MKDFCLSLFASLVLALALAGQAQSAERIRIAAPDISNLLTKHHDGIYQRLLARAAKDVPWHVTESFYPYERALMVFKQSKVDCIYSFTDVLKRKLGANAVIASYPLGKFAYYLFSLKGHPSPNSLGAISGKEVGAVIGHENYLTPILKGHDIKVFWSKSDELNLAMLEHHRFDTVIAALPDIRPWLDKLTYSPGHPLMVGYDRLTCHNTDRNRAFISALSKSLRRLKSAGIYQEIAGPLYFNFSDAPGTDGEPGTTPPSGRTSKTCCVNAGVVHDACARHCQNQSRL